MIYQYNFLHSGEAAQLDNSLPLWRLLQKPREAARLWQQAGGVQQDCHSVQHATAQGNCWMDDCKEYLAKVMTC